jgi:DNA modification methylase
VPTPYYQDDAVTLYHGDCLEIDAWLAADVLITDPPYGMNADLGRIARKGEMHNDSDTGARDRALGEWGSTKPAACFGHWRRPRPKRAKHLIVWDKVHMALGDESAPFATTHEEVYILGNGWTPGRRPTVLRYPNLLGGRRPAHPTPKPVGLMEWLILCAPDGTIADPFAGSGSTLLAARNLGRKAIGVEMEERYCELIADRLSQGSLDFGTTTATPDAEMVI